MQGAALLLPGDDQPCYQAASAAGLGHQPPLLPQLTPALSGTLGQPVQHRVTSFNQNYLTEQLQPELSHPARSRTVLAVVTVAFTAATLRGQ